MSLTLIIFLNKILRIISIFLLVSNSHKFKGILIQTQTYFGS